MKCETNGMVGPRYPGMNAGWMELAAYEEANAKAKRYYLAGKMFECPTKVHNPPPSRWPDPTCDGVAWGPIEFTRGAVCEGGAS